MKKILITIYIISAAMIGGEAFKRGDTTEVDELEFIKLVGLGLAKKYNKDTDGIKSDKTETLALEAKVSKLEEVNGGLEARVSELIGFVQAAIELPKGQVPNGFEG